MLWLSIQLPHLALELFPREAAAAPWAVWDGPDQRPLIHARNRAAAAAGITIGMSLGAARSLSAALVSQRRDPRAEREALEALALWAQQFTPLVHLQPPDGLLLEVAGSLALFGGLESLHRRIADGLAALGYHPRLAAAPTPLGSWLLASHRRPLLLTERAALRRELAELPVGALAADAKTQRTLRGLGLRRLADLLALPRAEFSRRFGPALRHTLDRALGELPDPRLPFTPPPLFHARLPLPAEVENSAALLFAARRLVLELVGYLRARSAGSQELVLTMEHRQRPASTLRVGLVQPSRDADHLLLLLKERLERFELPAPTDALVLESAQLRALEQGDGTLFERERQGDVPATALLERLRARLGHDAVTTLALRADHRPERAAVSLTGAVEAGTAAPPAAAARPLWLLPAPAALDGALRLLSGPERIESGWWDGEDVVRDYFTARNAAGELLWVFQDQRSKAWFVHGLFG